MDVFLKENLWIWGLGGAVAGAVFFIGTIIIWLCFCCTGPSKVKKTSIDGEESLLGTNWTQTKVTIPKCPATDASPSNRIQNHGELIKETPTEKPPLVEKRILPKPQDQSQMNLQTARTASSIKLASKLQPISNVKNISQLQTALNMTSNMKLASKLQTISCVKNASKLHTAIGTMSNSKLVSMESFSAETGVEFTLDGKKPKSRHHAAHPGPDAAKVLKMRAKSPNIIKKMPLDNDQGFGKKQGPKMPISDNLTLPAY